MRLVSAALLALLLPAPVGATTLLTVPTVVNFSFLASEGVIGDQVTFSFALDESVPDTSVPATIGLYKNVGAVVIENETQGLSWNGGVRLRITAGMGAGAGAQFYSFEGQHGLLPDQTWALTLLGTETCDVNSLAAALAATSCFADTPWDLLSGSVILDVIHGTDIVPLGFAVVLDGQPTVVPEPSTSMLLLVGGVALAALTRRR
ncbi:MAG: PEP-CTERM sorting domain-containing protein [Proteobacteria bacterium]|nr:PEP-CTERM sorting domain-containing protein [Pseudomonadota bacterium]